MAPKSGHFPKIFEPAFLGPLEVRNRLIMAPMGTRLANENGGISPWQIDYYAERAKGGVGAIIVEITGVDSPHGPPMPMGPGSCSSSPTWAGTGGSPWESTRWLPPRFPIDFSGSPPGN
jgi:2,4-dienoyl-CoA reductase-like NADH-dependent reductase (Old Yellow Enzyme family)